jgi:histidyl-tRNA synthetase
LHQEYYDGKSNSPYSIGLYGAFAGRQVLFDKMVEMLRASFSLYGFTPLDTPVIESSRSFWPRRGGDGKADLPV